MEKGLVSHRAQQIERGVTAITSPCASVSYGVVVNQIYKQEDHFRQKVMRDKRDKKIWAVDQIEWLIRKVEAP